jgi:hypothetical protein
MDVHPPAKAALDAKQASVPGPIHWAHEVDLNRSPMDTVYHERPGWVDDPTSRDERHLGHPACLSRARLA